MKDLIALIVILGLITFGMMITRQHYFENEERVNQDWRKRVYGRQYTTTSRTPEQQRPAPSESTATPTPSPTLSTTPTPTPSPL